MDFKGIVDIMFTDKKNWNTLSDTDKSGLFFIFNRYMSKKYPVQAQYFNDRNMDKATCMDIWFQYLKKETRTPFWFWKGATKKKDPDIKGWQTVFEFYGDIDKEDIYLLCEMFPKEFKEEIKRIELIKKEE